MVYFVILSEFGRDSGQSLDSVRTASKSKKKPLTASSDGHESPRWRGNAAAPRHAVLTQVMNTEWANSLLNIIPTVPFAWFGISLVLWVFFAGA